jgi:predicted enzyme related to lactoylglutathione lyase
MTGKNPIRWFEIYVKDMERAKKFYESVFQVKLERLSSPAAELEMWSFPSEREGSGCSGALAKMKGAEPHGFGTIVYFASDDCAVEEQRVVPSGGKIQRPKISIGQYGFITLAIDTEGNMIGIHSMK